MTLFVQQQGVVVKRHVCYGRQGCLGSQVGEYVFKAALVEALP
jgi:hypothetical protein